RGGGLPAAHAVLRRAGGGGRAAKAGRLYPLAAPGEAPMSDIATDRKEAQAPRRGASYLTAENGLLSWFGTTDHKRIALLYAAALTVFFFIGGAAAVLIRLELFTPKADLLSADGYNR